MNVLRSAIRLTIGLTLVMLVTLFSFPILFLLLPFRGLRIRWGNFAGKIIGRSCLYLSEATLPDGIQDRANHAFPAIYISNHTSIHDIFIGTWLGPYGVCGIAKKQVIWYPFFGFLYFLSGHLRIDRGNTGRAIEAFRHVSVLMKRHRLGVWLWPEGTRARDGRLQPFKKGFAHLALATRLPIVPVVVSGAHKGWKKGSAYFEPVNIDVRVLDPIPTDTWTLETLDAHVAAVYEKFLENLPAEQHPIRAEASLAM